MNVVNNLMNNRSLLFAQTIMGIILLIIFLGILFTKSSRDERGRGVVGRASIISLIYLMIVTSFFGQNIHKLSISIISMSSIIQFIANTVLLIEIIFIIVFKYLGQRH